uniref:Calmodulin-binding transcription activator 1 n=1 Tax=Aceria tosichella TaxID=561515 RepID=A0A6G1SK82_9ACAR
MNEHPSSPPPICAAPVVISGSGNSTTQPTMTQASTAKEAPNNLTCNGTGLMRASDLDLRKTKGELFSKLTERQPQQMIVTPALLNRRSSDENINSTSSLFKSLNRVEFTCHGGSSSNCSADTLAGSQQASGQQQQQNNSAGQHKQQKTIASSMHQQASETTSKQQQQASLMAGIKQEPPLFSRVRSKWYTNEEVASILTSYSDHPEWQSNELQLRPKSGAVLLYSREKVRYRQDGYCWKKRKNGRTTREDHMKLKVQGIECIYGCYVHSALLPTFHRRCYWLLENPDTVLVHYLNQPPDDKNKMILTFNSGLLESDTKRRWTNEEIIEEIGSVFGGISQIHRTLSINFPTTTSNNNSNNSVAVTANPLALLPGASGNNNNNSNNTSDGGCNVQQGNRQQQQQQKAQLNDGKLANGSVSLMMATNNEASDNGAKLIGSNNLGNNNNQQLGMVIINELNSQASLLQANSTISPSNDNGTNVVDKRLNTTAANDDGDDDDDVDEDDDDYELEEPQQQQEMEEKLLGSDNLMIARTRSINRWTPPHKNTKRLLAADPAGAAASQAGLESTIANDKDEKGASGDVGGNAKGWRKNESINPNSIIWSQQDRLLDAGPPGDHEPRGASKLDDDDAKNEIIGPDWTPTKTSYPGDGASSDEDEDEEEDDDDEEEEEVDLDKTLVDFDKTTDDDQRRRPMRRLSASERRRRLDYDLGLLESLVGKTMDDMPSP